MGLKTGLRLIGAYFFRWVGFSVEPTLIRIGKPTLESPVFLTCNFILTVRRVIKALRGLDCYLLIAPSKGINVWCGACGDDFNTDSVISIIKTSNIKDLVIHRNLILPQLSAPGINPLIIKKKLGWNVKFGPVYAKDIPMYMKNHYEKKEELRVIKFPILKRVEMANMYFFTILLLFSLGFWIAAIFIVTLDLLLFLNSIFIIILVIYGSLLILPSIKTKTGRFKVLIFEVGIIILISVLFIYIFPNIFFLIWNFILSLLVTLILTEDFNGLTPIYKSELGEKTWKKGKDEMKFMMMKIKLQPYGEIKLEREKCIGCKLCIEVCPKNLYIFSEKDNKVDLHDVENCINCNACVKRCLAHCLEIV